MNDADLIEAGAHVDAAISHIARMVEARDNLPPGSADAHAIAAITALSLVVEGLYREQGARGIKFAVDAMAGLEADYWNDIKLRMPRTNADKVN